MKNEILQYVYRNNRKVYKPPIPLKDYGKQIYIQTTLKKRGVSGII